MPDAATVWLVETGHTFPGFGTGKVVSDAEDKELPVEVRGGIGTAIELDFGGTS